jgi:hypothetical protein
MFFPDSKPMARCLSVLIPMQLSQILWLYASPELRADEHLQQTLNFLIMGGAFALMLSSAEYHLDGKFGNVYYINAHIKQLVVSSLLVAFQGFVACFGFTVWFDLLVRSGGFTNPGIQDAFGILTFVLTTALAYLYLGLIRRILVHRAELKQIAKTFASKDDYPDYPK